MRPCYPHDRNLDPAAVPGIAPEPEIEPDVPSITLEVDGETFSIRSDGRGGTDYIWLSGPNPGYGFGVSPTHDLPLVEHVENVREFLADIDPDTGYLRED